MVLFLFPISPNTIKTIRWGWKLFFFSVLAIALKELERYNVQFQDRGNHKDPFLILTNASISFRSCSRTCSYVVSKVFPLCSLALMKAFASSAKKKEKKRQMNTAKWNSLYQKTFFNGPCSEDIWSKVLLVIRTFQMSRVCFFLYCPAPSTLLNTVKFRK